EVVDADGRLLRAFVTKQGRWRFRTSLDDVDGEYTKLLIAYEDKRFWTHFGVDPRAMLRAAGQFIVNGRIVSGGSTITMQLARLLEPRKNRSLKSKLHQMARAVQIERQLGKKEILEAYLMLAPYGGNLEGIRAASLAYFGKEPKGLTLAQSALLVALPQSPERRRPDRFSVIARKARDVVLARMADADVIARGEVERAATRPVSATRRTLPRFAAHLAQRAILANPDKQRHQTTLKRHLQQTLEQVAREHAKGIGPRVSVALVLADAQSGRILAEVGSPDYLDQDRAGWIDMSRAIRSPGSALKPFVYGLAFEEGLVKPETLIIDSPANFAGYRPQNFDTQYQGEISIRRALQLSLNVPAVQLLEAVGPNRLAARFRQTGVTAELPQSGRPSLAIGLGGMGISLRDLTQLYTALANGGQASKLHDESKNAQIGKSTLLTPEAAWHVTDILSGMQPPAGSTALGIAYKTGTSYGYRDAWSVGYDGHHVLGVLVGRADNGSIPGITGRSTAAPILFDAFVKTGLARIPFKSAPAGALRMAHGELPITLQRFGTTSPASAKAKIPEQPPEIIYPFDGARVELGKTHTGAKFPLVMKLQNGRPPFRWLANGKPLQTRSRKRV
ncbi:MAG: penicillin-binding protein 1C, partial [Rhodobacteraceae bacterium]|nr:penicillin-binding protein 1C [Paracoccaceae bacterium]